LLVKKPKAVKETDETLTGTDDVEDISVDEEPIDEGDDQEIPDEPLNVEPEDIGPVEEIIEVLAEVVNQEEFQQHINDGAIEFEALKEEESFFEKLEDKVEEVLEKAEDKLEEVAHRIEEKVEEVIDMVEDSTPVQGLLIRKI
jgi:hypothetical protein